MRIIDADRLKEKMAVTLEVLKSIFPPGEQGAHLKAAFSTLGDMVDKCQTIDAVQVVRCKDCKYFHYSKPYGILIMNLVCDKWGKGCRTRPDGFCFMGERKDDATND